MKAANEPFLKEGVTVQFQSEDIDGILMVSTPSTDLDASNAEEFKKGIVPVVNGYSRVIMDLSGIGFMDSAGLGAILSVYKKVREEGGQFRVFGLSKEVKALFDLVRMQRLFELCEDREWAIRASQTS